MESPNTPMHIGALAVFELPDGASTSFTRDLYEAFSQLDFLPFPFDSVIAGPNLAYWKKVRPDASYHVRLSSLPRPGSDRDLGILVERLHSTPLDMTKPLWEAHIIEGLEGNRFAFYFKAHHCAVDGMGAINYIKSWLTTDPDAPPGSGTPEVPQGEESLAGELAIAAARETIAGLTAAGELLGRLTRMISGTNSFIQAAMKTPRSMFNTSITRHRRLAVEILELPRLKSVAAATGTTVNDVVLASIGGACRRYLLELDALPDQTLTASVPVGFDRDADTVNAASGFVTPLGTTTADPIERLREITAVTSRGKAEVLAMTPNALQHYSMLGLLPLAVGQKTGALGMIPPLFNCTVSNIVLGRQPLYLGGARLELIVPVSFLMDGYSLNVTLVGYTDKVTLGFVGCRDTIPHLQRLAQYTGAAFDEIEAAATAA